MPDPVTPAAQPTVPQVQATPKGATSIEGFRAKAAAMREQAIAEAGNEPPAPKAAPQQAVTDPAEPGAEPEAPEVDTEGDAETVEDLIHGMQVEALLAAIREGNVPEELLDKLRVKTKYEDQEEMVSLAELRKERLRLSDFSRRNTKLSEREREINATQDQFLAMVNTWASEKDDQLERTERDLMKLGVPMQKIAERIALRYAQKAHLREKVPEEMRGFVDSIMERNDALQRKLEEVLSTSETSTQTAEQQRRERYAEQVRQSVEKYRPAAFTREQIADTKLSRQVFYSALAGLWTDRSAAPSQQVVEDAVVATREELTALRIKHEAEAGGGTKPKQPGGDDAPAVPPARADLLPARRAAPGGGGRAAGGNAGPIRSLADFRGRVRKLGSPGF